MVDFRERVWRSAGGRLNGFGSGIHVLRLEGLRLGSVRLKGYGLGFGVLGGRDVEADPPPRTRDFSFT